MTARLSIGVDLGSTVIKAVINRGRETLWRGSVPTVPRQEEAARALILQGLAALGASGEYQAASTGYGKKLFTGARKNVDEISANARGLFVLSGGTARTIINIGGQDLKIIRLTETGQVADFKMNDKCAAGTGRFFEQAARILDAPLQEFAALGAASTKEVDINSTCAVFAESEIVSLLAGGAQKEDIIRGLCRSVARRIAALMGRDETGGVYLDGGPAVNSCLAAALEYELMTGIQALPYPQYTAAYGAALWLED
jgi:predicted CoA-substrate-specific enzyme activase